MIRDHMMNYLLDNNLLSTKHIWIYQKQVNFTAAATDYGQVDRVLSGGQVDVMYSDFEKAFDKIPHKRLISKLISYGFNSTLINWIQDFLKSRKFRVRVNSSFHFGTLSPVVYHRAVSRVDCYLSSQAAH